MPPILTTNEDGTVSEQITQTLTVDDISGKLSQWQSEIELIQATIVSNQTLLAEIQAKIDLYSPVLTQAQKKITPPFGIDQQVTPQ